MSLETAKWDHPYTQTTADTFVAASKNVINDRFWVEDPSILFRPDRALEFVPTKSHTNVERLNALSRFFIYFGILLMITYRIWNLMFVPIIALFILYMVYANDSKLQQVKVENFDQDIKSAFGLPKDMLIGIDDQGNVCQRPTPHNPFANVTIDQYTTAPNRPDACKQSDIAIKDETEKYFNYNLYQNTEDVWNNRNSQRQFFTMPSSTIPNDREALTNWLYKQRAVCKDGDQTQCLDYDNLIRPGYS